MQKPGFNDTLKNQALASGAHIIITIHGTFAADSSDHGQKWWQCASDFTDNLKARLGEKSRKEYAVLPFHWSGNNADIDRQEGSRALAKTLDEIDKSGQPYSVIAHSHGGNVFFQSLLVARTRFLKRMPKHENLAAFISVGTPYFSKKQKGFVLLNQGFLFATFMIILGLSIVWPAMIWSLDGTFLESEPAEKFMSIILGIIGAIAATYLSQQSFARVFEQRYNKVYLKDTNLESRAMLITSHRDEAINVLKKASRFNPTIIKSESVHNTLSQILRSLGTILGILLSVYMATKLTDQVDIFGYSTEYILVLPIIYFLILLFQIIALLLAKTFRVNQLLAGILNNITTSTLRSAVTGENADWKITAVSEYPPYLKPENITLHMIENNKLGDVNPKVIDQNIDRFYDHFITQDLITDGSGNLQDIQAEFEEVTNNMLYHNAYFRDDEVVKIIADSILNAA